MQIQKIKLISNGICYGQEPSQEDEVEQHLTISATGRVWYTAYQYGGGFGNYRIGRRQQQYRERCCSGYPVAVLQYFDNELLAIDGKDIGDWELTIMDADHKKQEYQGQLCLYQYFRFLSSRSIIPVDYAIFSNM